MQSGAGACFSSTKTIDFQHVSQTLIQNEKKELNAYTFKEFIDLALKDSKITIDKYSIKLIVDVLNNRAKSYLSTPSKSLEDLYFQKLISEYTIDNDLLFHQMTDEGKILIKSTKGDLEYFLDRASYDYDNDDSYDGIIDIYQKKNIIQSLTDAFCAFVKTKPIYTYIITSYTATSSVLNINTLLAFVTSKCKYLHKSYWKFDVGYFNHIFLTMFIEWLQQKLSGGGITRAKLPRGVEIKVPTSLKLPLKYPLILYSGGSLFCDRFGIPVSSKLGEKIYLNAFLSTSASKSISNIFKKNAMYTILVPPELQKTLMAVESCTTIKGELEVILPIGSVLHVTKVTYRKSYNSWKGAYGDYDIEMTLQPHNTVALHMFKDLFLSMSKWGHGQQAGCKIVNVAKDIDTDMLDKCNALPKKSNAHCHPPTSGFFSSTDIEHVLKVNNMTDDDAITAYTNNQIDPSTTYALDIEDYTDTDISASSNNLSDDFKIKKYKHWYLYTLYNEINECDVVLKKMIEIVKKNIIYLKDGGTQRHCCIRGIGKYKKVLGK